MTCSLLPSRAEDYPSGFIPGRRLRFASTFEPNVDVFNRIVENWVSQDVYYNSSRATGLAFRMLWKSDSSAYGLWKNVVRHLLRLGPNNPVEIGPGNLLNQVLNTVDRPFESAPFAQKCLEILSESGVDVTKYLQHQLKHRFDPSTSLFTIRQHSNTSYRDRYLIVVEKPRSVSWEWYIDPTGSAFEVVNEFKNFGLGPQDPRFTHHGDTKEQDMEAFDWPFYYPLWQALVLFPPFALTPG